MKRRWFTAVVALGLGVVMLGTSPAVMARSSAPKDNACSTGGPEGTSQPGAFRASSDGSGIGDVSLVDANGVETTTTGRLEWKLSQQVTGNAGPAFTASPGTLFGRLDFELKLNGSSEVIKFESKCILEAGVFNTATDPTSSQEQDPFGLEVARNVDRGVEGEWQGIARDFPGDDQKQLIVAAIAVWSVTDPGVPPRFKLDIASASGNAGTCLTEGNPGAGFGGPTGSPHEVEIKAPAQNSGRAVCDFNQQQQQA